MLDGLARNQAQDFAELSKRFEVIDYAGAQHRVHHSMALGANIKT